MMVATAMTSSPSVLDEVEAAMKEAADPGQFDGVEFHCDSTNAGSRARRLPALR